MIGIAVNSLATTHTITVADFSFTPSTIPTVHPGDTVKWVWSSGTHTTTSTSVPSGAATWDHNMSSTSTSFTYIPTVPGTYTYHCSIHTSMTGSFVVISTTQVAPVSNSAPLSIFPNPAGNTINIQLSNKTTPASIAVVDLSGKVVGQYSITGDQPLHVADLPNGLYMLYATQDGNISKQKLIIAH